MKPPSTESFLDSVDELSYNKLICQKSDVLPKVDIGHAHASRDRNPPARYPGTALASISNSIRQQYVVDHVSPCVWPVFW
jgi:hypothetical protein